MKNLVQYTHRLLVPTASSILLLCSGCGTTVSSLVGSASPIEQKSTQYGVTAPTTISSDWKMISSGMASDSETQIADATYQNTKTQGIISINSSCNSAVTGKPNALSDAMNLLFLGTSNISSQTESVTTVSGFPALTRVIQGEMDGVHTKIQATVVQKNDCIYDLMHISKPKHFADDQAIFAQFVSSLRLK